MGSQRVKRNGQKKCNGRKTRRMAKPISYRLKCARTANGLSHFVMYGDVEKKESLL